MKYTPEKAISMFWSRVAFGADCWLWTGAVSGKNSYGGCKFDGRSQHAHRVAWQLHRGEIPEGLNVLHRCDVPLCVRPDHLFLGTQKDNSLDAKAKGRTRNQHVGITHCKRGHEFTLENTRLDGRGRQCRICDQLRKRPYNAEKQREHRRVRREVTN